MRVILVDDEPAALLYLERQCVMIPGVTVDGKFPNAQRALDYLRANQADLIFLDIEMPGLTGLEAVKWIREIQPEAGIVFVTAYEQYAVEAFRVDAISYLMKPCRLDELERVIRKAARLMAVAEQKRVRFVTFGYFQMLIDGEPYRFVNAKAKEMLALLIDRWGNAVSMEQACDILWENRPYDNAVKQLYRKTVSQLHQAFARYQLDFFVSNRGSCHIIPSKINCDYYRLLSGDGSAARLYNGEYLLDYSWAEPTNGKIQRFLHDA